MRSPDPLARRGAAAGWWILSLLLALTVGRAATAPRERWPSLVGDEATYLMQAESLAYDGDLRFAPEDLARFEQRRGHAPEIILQSGDRGGRIVYGKPFLYAAAIAPLVRLLGERGALLANALALSAAGLLSALALARRGSRWGPLWIAVALFASVAFGHVYWIHADLFLMAATACGLALAHLLRSAPARGDARSRRGRPLARSLGWLAAGALLAVPGVWRPPYLLLVAVGAFLAIGDGDDLGAGAPGGSDRGVSRRAARRGDRRLRDVTAFFAGAAMVIVAAVGGQERVSGNWSPYAGERMGFSGLEGYPGVDFPAAEWSQRVATKGNTAWLVDGKVEASVAPLLVGSNLLYLFAGRTVGLLPYFLPAIAALPALLRRRCGAAARIEAVAGLAVALAFMIVTPFNFYGGAGALANRYFLPVFPLFWFGGAGLARCVATTLLAAPFVLPLWMAPAAYPIVPGEGYRYVSTAARRLLPVETTQRNVKAPGRPDLLVDDLWVRFLDGGITVAPPAAAVPASAAEPEPLTLAPNRRVEILIGHATPLLGVAIESFGGDAAPVLRVAGPGTSEPGPGSTRVVVRFDHPSARHPMWWTPDPFFLYHLTIESTSPAGAAPMLLRLRAVSGE